MDRRVALTGLACILLLLAWAPRSAVADPGVVTTAGGRLRGPDGAGFFLLGANYVGGPDRSWAMWQDGRFDAGLIEQDLLRARAAGLNTLRLFVQPPLQQEIAAGQWRKLDAVLGLAEQHGISLIVTLYDYREDDLAKVAALDGAIARRYATRRAVLAYDLKNEPHYQDLADEQILLPGDGRRRPESQQRLEPRRRCPDLLPRAGRPDRGGTVRIERLTERPRRVY
ncbi:MAG: cellulase family glycosylhydrolase [Chloroflexi bacterium]|nr:cellulase family glycosylhydrolase [Chloroflexota bacterium]